MNGPLGPVARPAFRDRREIRVFVSSTFRDMKRERDELIKRVFPQLRKICERRGVAWAEVDLRWGITEEQAEQGHVLPICLEEIRRCRPYFIGLLGERYGFVPPRLSAELVARESWLQEHHGRSLTELEIVHGALTGAAMAGHSYFYFRDPTYVERLPPGEVRSDYLPESPESAAKLARLKDAIRATGSSLKEHYGDPVSLGQLVLRDFSALVDRLFPSHEPPTPLDREADEQEAIVARLSTLYLPRRNYFDRLDAYADGDGPPVVVIGESGSGKSALLANWIVRRRSRSSEELVLSHFIGATSLTDANSIMLRLIGELRRSLDIKHPLPATPEAARTEFGNWLSLAAAKRPLVIVLDGLEQLDDRGGARQLDFIPPSLPPRVRLVVSTLPGPSQDAAVGRGWQPLAVEALGVDGLSTEREQIIVSILKEHAKALTTVQLSRIAASAACRNPLFLVTLVDELRQLGEHEALDARIEHYLQARDPGELFMLVLDRYELDYDRDRPSLTRDVFSLLCVARRGLAEPELLDVLGTGDDPLPQSHWSPLFVAADRNLSVKGGLLGFSHAYLRRAAESRFLPTTEARDAAHMRLARYFEARDWSDRQLDEMPWHLVQARRWQELYGHLRSPEFLERAWLHDKYDTLRFWTSIEGATDLRATDAYAQILGADTPPAGPGWSLANLFHEMGRLDEAFVLRSRLVDQFRQAGDLLTLADALPNYAASLRAKRQHAKALAIYQEAMGLYRQQGNQVGVALCLNNSAVVHIERGEFAEALALLREEEALARSLEDWNGVARSLTNQASIRNTWGETDQALALLDQAAFLDRRTGDLRGELIGLSLRAKVHRKRGQLKEALAALTQLESHERDLGDWRGVAHALEDSSQLLQKAGDAEAAFLQIERAAEIWTQLADEDGLTTNRAHQAQLLTTRGQYAQALELLIRAEQHFRAHDRAKLATCLVAQADISSRTADLPKAARQLKEAEQIYARLFDRAGTAAVAGSLGWIFRLQGRLQDALTEFQKMERICRETGDVEGRAKAIGQGAIVVKAAGNLDAALALHKQEEELLVSIGHTAGLAVCCGNQGAIYSLKNDDASALSYHDRQEQIVRSLKDLSGLAGCLGNKAFILERQGKAIEALAQHQESERLFRQLGEATGIAKALAAQALIYGQRLGQSDKAHELLGEMRAVIQQFEIASLAELPAFVENELAKL